jgi:hypothetical protein
MTSCPSDAAPYTDLSDTDMNRLSHRLAAWGLAAALLFVSACDLTDMNENPNEPLTVTPTNLLTRGQHLIAANTYAVDALGWFGNIYSQYWTQNQYTAEDRFDFPYARSGSVSGMWNTWYVAMNNLEEIIRLYEDEPGRYDAFGHPGNMEAIALIMQAYTFQLITDIWGAAPFSEALQGTANPAPSYDSQQEIYVGILDKLTRANSLINVGAPGPTPGSADLVYGGDMARWKKFANSLKLRVAIRIADVMPSESQQAIEQALAAGVFTSIADRAESRFSASPPYRNPIFNNYDAGRDDWAVTSTLVDYMRELGDPRLPSFADPSDRDGTIVGFDYGQENGAAQAQYSVGAFSRPAANVRQANTPGVLMRYDEVLFIQAEAAQRWGIGGSAAGLYEQAIRASMADWGVTDQAAINAFVANVPYNAANWRQSIGRQKWVALYNQGTQGWSEWRRLDFGLLRPPAGGSIPQFGRDIAVRLPYPTDEQTLNQANWLEAVNTYIGGSANDHQGTRLWWDVQ